MEFFLSFLYHENKKLNLLVLVFVFQEFFSEKKNEYIIIYNLHTTDEYFNTSKANFIIFIRFFNVLY